jgi:hypothetical protein
MEKTDGKIIYNAIKTPDGTILVSKHRHDYNCYTDKNGQEYCVDGGFEYLRRSYSINDYEDVSVYNTDNIEKIREVFSWGTYGKLGNEPLRYILLKDMETSHIENILSNLKNLQPHIKDIFERELKYRINTLFKQI